MVVVLVRHPTSLEMIIHKLFSFPFCFALWVPQEPVHRSSPVDPPGFQSSVSFLHWASLGGNTFMKVAGVKPLQLVVNGALPDSG